MIRLRGDFLRLYVTNNYLGDIKDMKGSELMKREARREESYRFLNKFFFWENVFKPL